MSLQESIHHVQKVNLIRYGDADVFGEDSGERRKLSEEEAVHRFGDLWDSLLATNVESAEAITREKAIELLDEKLKSYVQPGYTYREFSLCNVPFIARMTGGGYCDQLWALGGHRDNTRLCVRPFRFE